MEIVLKIQGNIYNLMRQCGYFFKGSARQRVRSRAKSGGENKGELIFSRIISASKSGYPRFHAYVKVDAAAQQTRINLHLDQKKPTYQRAPAHSAEYEGELVEKEVARIKQILGL